MRAATILGILLIAAMLVALAPTKGSYHATSGTTTIVRTFRGPVSNLAVAPVTADVVVIHDPHYVNADSFTVRAGDVMNWDGLGIYGFTVIRASATAVDAYWW